jgi:hypothetical protein
MAEQVRVGIVYEVQPEPPDPDQTVWLDAGAIRLGLEPRVVDPERLREAYAGDEAALAEIEANQPEGGFHDSGVSIHVLGSDDGHEYLRFDAFQDDPHYHYVKPSGNHNHWVPFDPISGGDILSFALRCLRERLDPMLRAAGGDAVADALDPASQAPVIDEIERRARALRDQSQNQT